MKRKDLIPQRFASAEVASIYESYPYVMRIKLLYLRQLIIETASETGLGNDLEETLKWGEPSYLTPSGSTIRIAWKESKPKQYAMYFHCKTKLLGTFKEIYGNTFKFEGNRAIIFDETDSVAITELKHCIELALTYHNIKHLPLV